ncbi:hypothetical protein GCM10027578_27680 [Spirosoma luteolum]
MSYDGGTTWTLMSHNPQAVRVVSRIGQSIVSANRSGAVATVYWSRDGGESWRTYELSQPQRLNGTVFVRQFSPQHVVVVTEYLISTTTDGGRSWSSRPVVWPGRQFYKLLMLSPTVMYAFFPLDGRGQLVKTTDGGRSWITLSTPFNPTSSLSFADENTGLVGSTNPGDYFRTTDGGKSWERTPISIDGQLVSPTTPQMINASVAYVWESERMFKTTNGGQTWQQVDLSATRLPVSAGQFIHSCMFSSEAVGYLNRNGQLYKTTTGGQYWTSMGSIPALNGYAQITADSSFIFLSDNYYGELGKLLLRPVPPKPHRPIGKAVGCLGVQQTYQITSQDAYSYEWRLRSGGQLTANRGVATVAVTTPGTYTLSVRSVDECGTSEQQVIELPVRVRPASPRWEKQTLEACPVIPAPYQVSGSESMRYVWHIGDSLLTDVYLPATELRWPLPGGRPYVLSVQADDGYCLSDPLSSTVVVKTLPDKPRLQQISATELGSDPTSSVQWVFGGQPIPGATGPRYSLNQGTGYYAVRSVNECGYTQSDSLFFIVTDLPAGTPGTVLLYPNPAHHSVHVSVTQAANRPMAIQLTTSTGQPVLRRTVIHGRGLIEEEIDVSHLPAGVYLICVGDDERQAAYKLIKQ